MYANRMNRQKKWKKNWKDTFDRLGQRKQKFGLFEAREKGKRAQKTMKEKKDTVWVMKGQDREIS